MHHPLFSLSLLARVNVCTALMTLAATLLGLGLSLDMPRVRASAIALEIFVGVLWVDYRQEFRLQRWCQHERAEDPADELAALRRLTR